MATSSEPLYFEDTYLEDTYLEDTYFEDTYLEETVNRPPTTSHAFALCSILIACGADCPEGSEEENGMCVQTSVSVSSSTIEAQLIACGVSEGDGRLNLYSACVDDACVGQTYAELVDVLGPPVEAGSWMEWAGGIGFDFDVEDLPPNPDAVATELWLQEPFTGSTDEGLGVGVPLSCFLEALPEPDDATLEYGSGSWHVENLDWQSPDLMVFDGSVYVGDGDGIVGMMVVQVPE